MDNELLSQFTSAAVVVYVIQWLKRSAWVPWLTMETTKRNWIVGAAAAAVSACGIHVAYKPLEADGTLIVTGLSLTSAAHGIWHLANHLALNRVTYDGGV